jgi:hypothetical protein
MKAKRRWPAILVAAVLGSAALASTAAQSSAHARRPSRPPVPNTRKTSKSGDEATPLPRKKMEAILQIEGSVSDQVLSESFDQSKANNVTIHGVPIKSPFEINGEADFQPVGAGRAFLNGDVPVLPQNIDKVVDTIVNDGLVFQAEHQHMYDFEPMVWFIHFRGKGNPLRLANAAHSLLEAAEIPLPQAPPPHPTTPLNKNRLKSILHGYEATVSEDGVVTVYVARKNSIQIKGVTVKPETNVATNVAFEPLNAEGSEAAAVPDFAMEAGEINPLMTVMRRQGWDIGCLYNQETGEHPQLFFSHQFKTGNPYSLAEEIRRGLDQTNAK